MTLNIAIIQLIINMFSAFAACVAAGAGFVAAMHSWRNATAIHAIHVEINSRVSQLLDASAKANFAEGEKAGIASGAETLAGKP